VSKGTKTAPAGSASGIDWKAIHQRLERAAAVLEQKMMFTPEEKKKILKTRAKNLARERQADGRDQEHLDILEFVLAYERYAIESSWVREVYPLKELTPLPGTPSFVLGIINVRGQIVSVVDLKRFFDLPARGLTDLNKVIIISDGRMEFGLLADAVSGVRQVPVPEIQPPLPTLTGVRGEYLKGVTADRLVVLDVAKLLADPKVKISQSTDA
jgi:purine-binding chemotaxis protein CheW